MFLGKIILKICITFSVNYLSKAKLLYKLRGTNLIKANTIKKTFSFSIQVSGYQIIFGSDHLYKF
jgi:hypothetical protein